MSRYPLQLISKIVLAVLLLSGCRANSGDIPGAIETSQGQDLPAVTTPAGEPPVPTQSDPDPGPPAVDKTEAAPGPTPAPTPSPSELPLTQYEITVELNYLRRQAAVSQQVTFTHRDFEPVSELLFIVDANRYWDAFLLTGIFWGDGTAVEGQRLEKDRLQVPLLAPLQYGESVSIRLDYLLNLPMIPPPNDTQRPQPFGYTVRQLNLVDWYPFLPPFLKGSGWTANQPWYFGEHQIYDLADFHITISLIDPPPDLTIAASSLPDSTGETTVFTHRRARSFALTASHMYQVYSTTVAGVQVNSYAFPFDGRAGQAALEETAEALRIYSELFGPYPHSSLSVVEADFLDGMEYDGLYFLSRGFYNIYDGTPAGYLTMIAVHETSHQWWYGLVANDQGQEPWLDEAIATYSELLFYENAYPDLLSWWWAYRIHFYEPSGFINLPIYEYSGFRPYRDSVYLNGAIFLHQLREKMGDEQFFHFLKTYSSQLTGEISTTAAFFDLLDSYQVEDLQELISKYFRMSEE
jgi:hypothetical protein